MGRFSWRGFRISLEHPKGSVRRGKSKDGKAWERTVTADYGKFLGILAADNELLDVWVGDDPASELVFVIDQVKPGTQDYDEGKVIIGTRSEQEARDLYLSNYPRGWTGLGDITALTLPQFKAWCASGNSRKPAAGLRRKVAADHYPDPYGSIKIRIVNDEQIRDLSPKAEEFGGSGTAVEYPDVIPPDEIWIADTVPQEERDPMIAGGLARIRARKRGLSADAAYEYGLRKEKSVRERLGMARQQPDSREPEPPNRIYEDCRELDGVSLCLVNGEAVRDTYKTDAMEGMNGYAYPWVPRNEIWIEATLHPEEMPFIAAHELYERYLMLTKQMPYHKAHELASQYEWALREERGEAKQAALNTAVPLQPQQERLKEEAEAGQGVRKLLFHSLGSGKSRSAITAAETLGEPYTAVVPASLQNNMAGEIARWTAPALPHAIMSYTSLARGRHPQHPHTLIYDEAHRLRSPASLQTQAASQAASQARNLYLLSGSPIVNRPSDLAPLISMLTERELSPKRFDELFLKQQKVHPGLWGSFLGVTPGDETHMQNKGLFRKLLAGHVDYHEPGKPAVEVTEEHHDVPMSQEQTRLYQAFWDQLPWIMRWKLQRQFPLSKDEIRNFASFMSGPRQVSLSTLPFMRGKHDPLLAFQQSPKLQTAMQKLQQHLQSEEPRKAVIYSNFIGAGLEPYAAALTAAGIPHGMFHGGISVGQRKKAVEDFNKGHTPVLLLGPAGGEGISLKGTTLMQVLDPHWNEARSEQAIGRGIRFDSHVHLPPDQRKITVQRFASHLPPGVWQKLFRALLQKRPDTARSAPGVDYYLQQMAKNKNQLNEEFLEELKQIGQEKHEPGFLDWLFGKSGADKDFALGLPKKHNFGDHTQLKPGSIVRFNRQTHAAHRAGLHEDWRLELPGGGLLSWAVRSPPAPGERKLAVRQPLHRSSYLGWEGAIPRGQYGGGTVKSKELGHVLVTEVTPHSISFTTATSRYPERYTLVRPASPGFKENEWLLHNTSLTAATPMPYTKLHFHSLPHEYAEQFLSELPEDASVQPKIDGASSLILLGKDRIEVLSYRLSKLTGRPLPHTERFFGGQHKVKIPPELVGTVLRGELYGVRQSQPGHGRSAGHAGSPAAIKDASSAFDGGLGSDGGAAGTESSHNDRAGSYGAGERSLWPDTSVTVGGPDTGRIHSRANTSSGGTGIGGSQPGGPAAVSGIDPASIGFDRTALSGYCGRNLALRLWPQKTAGIFEQYSTDAAAPVTPPASLDEAIRTQLGSLHNPAPPAPGGSGKLQQQATGAATNLFLRLGQTPGAARLREEQARANDPTFAVPGLGPSYSPGGGEGATGGQSPSATPAGPIDPGQPASPFGGADASGTGNNLQPGYIGGDEEFPDAEFERMEPAGEPPRPATGAQGAKFGYAESADLAGYSALGAGRAGRSDSPGIAGGGDSWRSGRVVHPAELGGILNAGIAKSLHTQRSRGIQLRNMVFDIEQLGRTPIDFNAVPHRERRKLIEQVLKHLPGEQFHLAPEARTPEEARRLWDEIKGKRHPYTSEGIVVHRPLGKPTKIKLRNEADVFARGIFPGIGKYSPSIGGLTYSLGETGPVIGRIGTGFSDELRQEIANNPTDYIGRRMRIIAQEQFPSGAYRGPVFLAFHEDY